MGASLGDISAGDLHKVFIRRTLPQSERFRTFFGREADMETIRTVLRQAELGYLVQFTDFTTEALGLEPHLSALLGKRFGSVQCLDWDLVPPTGPDVDKAEAQLIADKVRQDFQRIPHFSERIYDLMWANYDGRAALELHWGRTTGKFPNRIMDLNWIHPRRQTLGPAREIRIIDPQRSVGNFRAEGLALEDFPGKFLWWKPRLYREYPELEGLARRSLYWTFFKRFSWRQRMILTELFGVPWRIIEQDADAFETYGSNKEGLLEGESAAEKLGQESTALLDPGQKLTVVSPDPKSGELFGMTHDQVNEEMSKIVLGNTATTDSTSNRANTIVQKTEQDIILQRDAGGAGERITEHMVKPTVFWNFGPDSMVNAPSFVLRAEPPRDMAKEQERADKAIMVGVPVAISQYREITGLREPEPDEPFLVGRSPGRDAMGAPLPHVATIVDPTAETETNADDAANQAPALEEGGNDEAAERAEDDLLAAVQPRDPKAYERTDPPVDVPEGDPVKLPFAGFADFDACVIAQKDLGHDDDTARRICGRLQEETEASREQLEADREQGGPVPFRF